MTDKIIETNSEQETRALGMELARNARPGQIYALIGDLGVGKTVLTQGIAEGLGITEPVSSPTFTIVQVYEEGRMPFSYFMSLRPDATLFQIGLATPLSSILQLILCVACMAWLSRKGRTNNLIKH